MRHKKNNNHIGADLLCWTCGPQLTYFTKDRRRDGCSRQELSAKVPADKEMLFHQTIAESRISVNMDLKRLHLDDESLIRRIQEGSHEAFAAIVARHTNRFYRIAYRLVSSKDDAEEIVQEAFLKLWDRPNLWNPAKRAKFTTWFYRVVINLCFDLRKKKKLMHLSEDIALADENPGPDVLLHLHQNQVVLERFIRELPERQQLAVNLCFYEGLSNNEAAQIIGVKVKALQSLVMRAKTTLKYKVKRYLGGGLR